jgi:protein-L-isoaspartate(D-aspartate) O-methyltransferase
MNASIRLDFAKAREAMVEQQIRPWDVLDTRVLEVLAQVPREAFMPAPHRALAYADLALPLANGAQSLKPVVEGRMLQARAPAPSDAVLQVGAGNGFLAACFGRLAREVLVLEADADLAATARANLAATGLDGNVRVVQGGALQWQGERRFDAVCVTAAVDTIPPHFLAWLAPGGRLFVVRGRAPAMEAVLVRNEAGGARIESLFETELPYLAGATPTPHFQL